MSDSSSPNAAPPDGIVARPPGQLHDLPIRARWEVTRRNPYYLVFWAQARAFRLNQLSDDSVESYLQFAAHLILAMIGATGVPISPETSAEKLIDGDADLSFLTGAVQPVTFCGVTTMLLNGLPSAELEAIGKILIEAARAEYPLSEDALPAAYKTLAYARLSQVMNRALDSIPEIPLFYVHLGTSQNAIVRDMEDQVRRWKKRRGLGSSKVHTEKIDTYLEVWDLREGWTGSGYERGRELSFAAVARRLKSGSISKVATRYRAAFKLITGHDFSPELWLRVFGPLKLSELLGDPVTLLSKPIRHRFGSPGPRAVSDSVISPATDDVSTPGVVASSATVDGDIATAELLRDLKSLIDRGLSDNEVAAELDLNDPGLVAYYRSTIEELRSL